MRSRHQIVWRASKRVILFLIRLTRSSTDFTGRTVDAGSSTIRSEYPMSTGEKLVSRSESHRSERRKIAIRGYRWHRIVHSWWDRIFRRKAYRLSPIIIIIIIITIFTYRYDCWQFFRDGGNLIHCVRRQYASVCIVFCFFLFVPSPICFCENRKHTSFFRVRRWIKKNYRMFCPVSDICYETWIRKTFFFFFIYSDSVPWFVNRVYETT